MKFGLDNAMFFSWGLTQGTLESGARIPFISTWNTSQPGTSNSQQITLPLEATGNYNFVVDWGDGTEDLITAWNDAAKTHTYNSSGNYVVDIVGEIQGWFFDNGGDCQKLEQVSKWGSLRPGNSGSQFYGCLNMVVDAAAGVMNIADVTNMFQMFRNCTNFNQNIGSWNTANVTDMSGMFNACTNFNQNIGSWNTANVTDTSRMFYQCATFNQGLGSWNTVNMVNINRMFYQCTNFNQDIGNWNTANVTDTVFAFYQCFNFNQDIGSWNTANITDMSGMLRSCLVFDQDLGSWDVEALTAATGMLQSSTLATANYDSLLIGWAAQTVISGVNFHGGDSQYSVGAATAARASLVTDGWTITDGDQAP